MSLDPSFWEYVETIVASGWKVDRLVEQLARDGFPAIRKFRRDLSNAVELLGSAEHRGQDVRDVDAPELALPLSEDAFMDSRMAVVAQGYRVWNQVVHRPAQFAGVWPFELDGDLGQAPARAFELATGRELPPEPPKIGLAERNRWIQIIAHDYVRGRDARAQRLPKVYRQHIAYWEDVLDERPWWDWWDSFRPKSILECQIWFNIGGISRRSLRFDADSDGREIVVLRIDALALDGPGKQADLNIENSFLAQKARYHVGLIFEVLQSRLDIVAPVELETDLELVEAALRRRGGRRKIGSFTGG